MQMKQVREEEVKTLRSANKHLHEENLRLKERITRLLEQVNYFQGQERAATLRMLQLEGIVEGLKKENEKLIEYMERHNID